jgi:hypothetical protein
MTKAPVSTSPYGNNMLAKPVALETGGASSLVLAKMKADAATRNVRDTAARTGRGVQSSVNAWPPASSYKV